MEARRVVPGVFQTCLGVVSRLTGVRLHEKLILLSEVKVSLYQFVCVVHTLRRPMERYIGQCEDRSISIVSYAVGQASLTVRRTRRNIL